jgi:hypothetical protein
MAAGEHNRWLLVFDNAKEPEDVTAWLPGGTGHVLITSRTNGWAEVAVPVEVDVLARAESAAILQDRVGGLPADDADRVAEALGDLPLAVVQAAGYMADTGTHADKYLELLAERAAHVLDQGRPPSYELSLAAATELGFDRLRSDDPAAAALVSMCAFLAPEPVPTDWFTRDGAPLPALLAKQAANLAAWRQVLDRISRSALARIDYNGLQMHKLTQAIVRSYLPARLAATTRARAEAIVAARRPGDPGEPAAWPEWAQLLPHLLALDPATTGNEAIRELACDATWYLVRHGDARSGHDLASRLYQHWRDQLGPEDASTLWAANDLAQAMRNMGHHDQARDLDEDTLARRRRALGDDHPHTLASANNLANDLHILGQTQTARELHEDTLARRRRVLGDDHPDTLISASNLAADLRVLGDSQAARDLDKDTLARRRRVLGDDHPDTLISASNLAADLRVLGDSQAARDLDEDTLTRKRRVLGVSHPSTLKSASNLAADLRALGDPRAARDLDEDTLARRRRILGDDHPDTLASAESLAIDIRDLEEA